jgi:Zn finger protein HypA/HybF involved in hydrogenase expression
MSISYPEFTTHLTHFFDDSLCGLQKLDKRDLTYNLNKVTCMDCLEKSRLEAIENQRALDTLPHCPHCGGNIEYVTLTFTVTKQYRLDVQTERDFETKTIKPLIYGSEFDTLDKELVPDKEWQVVCENGHEFFTKKLETIEDGEQWFVKEGVEEDSESSSFATLCPVCGNDRSEHDWEVHTARIEG